MLYFQKSALRIQTPYGYRHATLSRIKSLKRRKTMIQVAVHPLYINGVGERIGFIQLQDTPVGLLLAPDIHGVFDFGLMPGQHGFHVHERGALEPRWDGSKMIPGGMAGEHYDPERTRSHRGPYRDGHRGDLPTLTVDENGSIISPVVAPRLNLSECMGRSLIIHGGGDNYTDNPPNGGGKVRVLGAVIVRSCPYCR
jgi:Cu-Zn family superoxide dismutase